MGFINKSRNMLQQNSQLRLKRLEQKGMTAMLFAMVFIIVLTLLAIGFATLVRNDQRQALDKSLSYQAQYAAETAINRQAEVIRAAAIYPGDQTTCPATPTVVGDASVTCLTWDDDVEEITHDGLTSEKPYVTVLDSPSWGATGSVVIKWNSSGYASLPSGGLPDVDSTKTILGLTISNGVDLNTHKVFYIVPMGASSNLSYGNAPGTIVTASCPGGNCTSGNITVNKGSRISLIAIGGSTDITIAPSMAGQKFRGAQIEIDANARTQEVTKRIKAKIDKIKDTWRPAYAISANRICKDIKVDAVQDKQASNGAALPSAVGSQTLVCN